MSHISQIELEVKDLESLKKAVAECGLEFRENQKTYNWYGSWVGAGRPAGMLPEQDGKCDHAIGVPGEVAKNRGAYEVGVVKNKDGSGYKLVADFYQGGYGLEALTGPNCQKLAQNYVGQVTKKRLTMQGFQIQRKVLADGTIKMIARR